MTAIYYTGILVFSLFVHVTSYFHSKARKFVKGRKKLWKKLDAIDSEEKLIWFHCASLGEFEQGRPLIEKIKKQHPAYKILLTFFSPSGYEIRKNYEFADYITYLPIDTPGNARKFIKKAKPQKAIFVKYEFWYFILRELKREQVEAYLISAMFRKDQFFFKWYGKRYRRVIGWFKHIFVQNESSYNLLRTYNYKNISLAGDTRLDRVIDIVRNSRQLPLVEKFREDKKIFIVGSSWKKDEDLIFRYYKENNKPFKLIVAPHEVHSSNIERISSALAEYKVVKYSEADETNVIDADILLIDSIGLLASLYRYGNVAYIGGGFGKGIHNLLEAATWGIPVIFGPNHQKFKEATGLIQTGGGFSIHDYESFKETLDQFIQNSEFLKQAGESSANYIKENSGATEVIMKKLDLD